MLSQKPGILRGDQFCQLILSKILRVLFPFLGHLAHTEGTELNYAIFYRGILVLQRFILGDHVGGYKTT